MDDVLDAVIELLAAGDHAAADALAGPAGHAFADAPGSHPPRPGLVYDPGDHHYHRPGGGAIDPDAHTPPGRLPEPPVRVNKAAPDVTSGVEHELAADPAAADPGTLGRVRAGLKAAHDAVATWLVKHQDRLDALGSLLGGYFDTPGDLAKFGYVPATSGPVATAEHPADPLKQMGSPVGTHLAVKAASAVLARAFVWLKNRTRTHADGTPDVAAMLADLFTQVNAAFGLPPVSEGAVAAAVAKLG